MSKFYRIDGTTKKEFHVGKPGKGITLEVDDSGEAAVRNTSGVSRTIGITYIRGDSVNSNSIPTIGATREAIDKKIRTVDSLDGVDLEVNDYVFLKKDGE